MPKKILAVDDERHIVRLIQVNLERAGYEVVTAYDGREALKKIDEERPDMVVLDVMMPYMDGFETLKQIRANPLTRNLPVIVLVLNNRCTWNGAWVQTRRTNGDRWTELWAPLRGCAVYISLY